MTENIEFKGQWFLPTDKNQRVNGILSYNPNEGCSLELFGNFDNNSFIPEIGNIDLIQGLSDDSKQITLYKCYISKAGGGKLIRGAESGTPSTIYTVNYILEGVHIDSLDDMTFHKITSEIHNLDEWVGISGFIHQEREFKPLKPIEINVKYKLPDPIKFKINGNLDGQFNFIANHSNWSQYQKEISLKQRVEIILTSSEIGFKLEELLKMLFSFQNFLILALYNRTYPTNITLYSNNFMKDYEDDKPIRRKIKLYFPISNRSTVIKSKSNMDMLFGYGHIKGEFSTIIKNWFEKYDLLEPAFNLLFEQFYNNERFSENTFLNLAQAAETFHARTHNHTRMSKNEYDKMKQDVYAAVPNHYHNWLKDQFSFGNHLNLHTRLTEIVTKYSNEVLDKIIGDKELFVKQVKWSRNYYTHYSSSGEKQALKGHFLFILAEKLKIVLVCTFLIEVGFDNEKLKKLLEQNKYRFFYSLAKW